MGSYATTSSLSNLLPNYLKGDTTSVDEAGKNRFSKHITRAESLVDSYIGPRYELPFIVDTATTNVPPILRTLTEDMACYYAMRGDFNQDGKVKNAYLDDFKMAMKTLEAIGKGDQALLYTDGSQVPAIAASRFASSTKNYTPIFGLDKATDWRRDPDEVADTEDLRSET